VRLLVGSPVPGAVARFVVCDAAALVRSPAYASPLSERPLFAAGCCVGVGVGVGVALLYACIGDASSQGR